MQDNGLIQELPLSIPFFRGQVETFLRESGLRMEELDHYYAFTSPDGSILAGAGIRADIIKCVAVAPSARSEGLMLPLLSRIVSDAAAKGILNLKVFTKPENQEIFESIGFKVLASAPKAILMENGRGLEKYC
ncbi:MAG: [Bacteroidales bacterium]|nr:[citrate (pro-3S)-lyase] ligase [Bacteroidales bacterium]